MTETAFKSSGVTIRLPSGHDFTQQWHSSIWPEDCHCQEVHWFCTHQLIEALAKVFASD